MSFTKTKDRVWVAYDVFAAWLARQPMPVRKVGYGVFGAVLWTAYFLPGNIVRPTFVALSRQAGSTAPGLLFRQYVKGFLLGINRIEQVRHGYTDAIDGMLHIPEQEKLETLLRSGGVVLVLPHTHASFAMGRGLARRYPLLALVRSAANERRAASEWEVYANLGCEVLDVRLEKPTTVARKLLAALNDGRLVVGTVDRIREAPPPQYPVDAPGDTVRAMAFGQAIGITCWPARFALKAAAPILPATVVQTADTISLRLGAAVEPKAELLATTQDWVDELENLLRTYPDEWTFALDKHWSRVLRNSTHI